MADSPRSLVRVVVPVYRELTPDEESSLRNNVRVLAAWPFTVLHPRGVTPPACCRELGLETRAVGDEWLGRRNGIAGYNRMMLSEEFYASFPDTEYILICHTDAWIFRDELGDWCRRGYDCVAAPWLRRPLYDLPLVKQYMQWREQMKRRRGEASRQVLYGRVGNGGRPGNRGFFQRLILWQRSLRRNGRRRLIRKHGLGDCFRKLERQFGVRLRSLGLGNLFFELRDAGFQRGLCLGVVVCDFERGENGDLIERHDAAAAADRFHVLIHALSALLEHGFFARRDGKAIVAAENAQIEFGHRLSLRFEFGGIRQTIELLDLGVEFLESLLRLIQFGLSGSQSTAKTKVFLTFFPQYERKLLDEAAKPCELFLHSEVSFFASSLGRSSFGAKLRMLPRISWSACSSSGMASDVQLLTRSSSLK